MVSLNTCTSLVLTGEIEYFTMPASTLRTTLEMIWLTA